jgi:hypothetical protein
MRNLKLNLLSATVALIAGVGSAVAGVSFSDTTSKNRSSDVQVAQGSSCGAWKSTCESRGGGASCDAKYRSCLKSGCFTEGAKFGGATHCSLAKQ